MHAIDVLLSDHVARSSPEMSDTDITLAVQVEEVGDKDVTVVYKGVEFHLSRHAIKAAQLLPGLRGSHRVNKWCILVVDSSTELWQTTRWTAGSLAGPLPFALGRTADGPTAPEALMPNYSTLTMLNELGLVDPPDLASNERA